MDLFDTIQDWFKKTSSVDYIITAQIPVVIGLVFQSYNAYKLNFRAFKFIGLGWACNLLYLTAKLIKNESDTDAWLSFIGTFGDVVSSFLFYYAVIFQTDIPQVRKLKVIKPINVGAFFLLCGFCQLFFKWQIGSGAINVHAVPLTLVDTLSIVLLAFYFNFIIKEFDYKKLWLFFATLLYAGIQFLAIFNITVDFTDLSIYSNIGFTVGLITKSAILISLSFLLLKIVWVRNQQERNKLLDNINYSHKIFSISGDLPTTATNKEKIESIIKNTFTECLNIANAKYAFYASYNKDSRENTIIHTSAVFELLKRYTYKVKEDITAIAIQTKKITRYPDSGKINEKPLSEIVLNKMLSVGIQQRIKSAVAIPVWVNQIVYGVFFFADDTGKDFNDTDIEIWKGVVVQAATAIETLRLEDEVELMQSMLHSLKVIDKNMAGSKPDIRNILEFILKKSLEMVKGDHGSVALLKENGLEIIKSSDVADEGRMLELEKSIIGLAVLRMRTIYVKDIDTAPLAFKKRHQKYASGKFSCELAIPLIVKNAVIGVINIESNTKNAFSKKDIENIEGFAGQAAIAILLVDTFGSLERHKKHIDTLSTIEAQILEVNHKLHETFDLILSAVLSLSRKSNAEIILVEKGVGGGDKLFIKKSTHLLSEGESISLHSICGMAINEKKTVYLPGIDRQITIKKPLDYNSNVYLPNDNERARYQISSSWGKMKSQLALPLIVKGKAIGVLNIESREYDDFKEDEIALLKSLSYIAAIAIHNSQQFEEINRKNELLEQSVNRKFINMSELLGRAINHRINNSVGAIRITLKRFLAGRYGLFPDNVNTQFTSMLESAERVLESRKEIKEKAWAIINEEPTNIDFAQVESLILNNKEFHQHGINIFVEGFRDLRPIKIHFTILMEAIINELITNAIKASKAKGGHIKIVGKNQADSIEITIEDQGIGIKESELEKIFQRYYTAWPDENESGNGIGLYELRESVNHYAGEITVSSIEGKGTTFKLLFPTT